MNKELADVGRSRHSHLQLLYIKQGRKAYFKAFCPIIIIEDLHLQTFLHSLAEPENPALPRCNYS